MVIHLPWVSAAAERITSSVVLRPFLTAVKKAVRECLATVDKGKPLAKQLRQLLWNE